RSCRPRTASRPSAGGGGGDLVELGQGILGTRELAGPPPGGGLGAAPCERGAERADRRGERLRVTDGDQVRGRSGDPAGAAGVGGDDRAAGQERLRSEERRVGDELQSTA